MVKITFVCWLIIHSWWEFGRNKFDGLDGGAKYKKQRLYIIIIIIFSYKNTYQVHISGEWVVCVYQTLENPKAHL